MSHPFIDYHTQISNIEMLPLFLKCYPFESLNIALLDKQYIYKLHRRLFEEAKKVRKILYYLRRYLLKNHWL